MTDMDTRIEVAAAVFTSAEVVSYLMAVEDIFGVAGVTCMVALSKLLNSLDGSMSQDS